MQRSWWRQLGLTLGWIGLAAALGVAFKVILPAHAADQGYFNCLGLGDDAREWFKSTGIVDCCNIADGMPVRYEERPDGLYVPPFTESKAEAVTCRDNAKADWHGSPPGEDHSHWIKVIDEVVRKKPNPVGVAVIWWTNSASPDPNMSHTVRCFVGVLKV